MDTPANPRTVLIIDDDRGLLRLIEKALQREGFATATAGSGEEARDWLAHHRAELLLLDLKLQDMGGWELFRQLIGIQPNLPFIIITGQGDERVAVEMMKRGARDYLVKDAQFLQFVPEVVRHVMEQIATERRLTAAEEQVHLVQSVMERGFSAVLITSAEMPDPEILYVTPTFARLIGCDREKTVGRRLSALQGLTAVQNHLQDGEPGDEHLHEVVSSYQTADGERWGEWRIGPVTDKSGRVTHWLVILRDITERRRLEKEILEISDREQRRIGQDLHDGLCQQLAGIELMSQVLEQKLGSRSADARRAGEIAGHVRDAIGQTRLLARGMSPVTLESEGLMSALQEFAGNTEKIFGVACPFRCRTTVLVRDQSVATHLFRIAQESVSNAIKHGKARRILIELAERPAGTIVLTVQDDGSGLPSPMPKEKGMGLQIMKSRAGMIGGSLAVENLPEKGVEVVCSVALTAAPKQNPNSRGRKTKTQPQKENPHR
ncbi:MAG: response regulator [Verrucomicrobiota bacterium]